MAGKAQKSKGAKTKHANFKSSQGYFDGETPKKQRPRSAKKRDEV